MKRLLALLILLTYVLVVEAGTQAVAVPLLSARVTDLTHTLTAQETDALEHKLATFEQKSGGQVVVLMLPTTQPETIEQFGIRVLDAWKLGRKGVDDSAILLIAKDDHRVRIEVGYGFEGTLNDATAHRIINEFILPQFKAGNYALGLTAGVDAILGLLGREAVAPATVTSDDGYKGFDLKGFGEQTLLFGAGLLAIGGAILRFFLGNLIGSGVVGVVAGGIGWWFTGSVLGALVGLIAGGFIAMFGMDLLLSGILRGGRHSGGSGGFRGGGGGGGGGGASGSW
jgi:uncharacterized protein